MSILYVMVPLGLALLVLAGWAFFWAVGNGQFDDLDTPGWDVLRDERAEPTEREPRERSRSAR